MLYNQQIGQETQGEEINPPLDKVELERSLEGTYPVLREIMEWNLLRKLKKAKDMSD